MQNHTYGALRCCLWDSKQHNSLQVTEDKFSTYDTCKCHFMMLSTWWQLLWRTVKPLDSTLGEEEIWWKVRRGAKIYVWIKSGRWDGAPCLIIWNVHDHFWVSQTVLSADIVGTIFKMIFSFIKNFYWFHFIAEAPFSRVNFLLWTLLSPLRGPTHRHIHNDFFIVYGYRWMFFQLNHKLSLQTRVLPD